MFKLIVDLNAEITKALADNKETAFEYRFALRTVQIALKTLIVFC